MRQTFMELVMEGKEKIVNISKYIEEWFEQSDKDISLAKYLGMKRKEYETWSAFKQPDKKYEVLRNICDTRFKDHIEEISSKPETDGMFILFQFKKCIENKDTRNPILVSNSDVPQELADEINTLGSRLMSYIETNKED